MKWDFNSSCFQRVGVVKRSSYNRNLISVCTLKQSSGGTSYGFTRACRRNKWGLTKYALKSYCDLVERTTNNVVQFIKHHIVLSQLHRFGATLIIKYNLWCLFPGPGLEPLDSTTTASSMLTKVYVPNRCMKIISQTKIGVLCACVLMPPKLQRNPVPFFYFDIANFRCDCGVCTKMEIFIWRY